LTLQSCRDRHNDIHGEILIMNAFDRSLRALLASKLNPPAATPSQVVRFKVCEMIRNASSAKLILVRAPAGFGKTTAMLQCRAQLQEKGVDTAWLTLDNGDNDASRFLTCLAEAVLQMTEGQDTYPAEAVPAYGPSLGDAALDIMERLAAHSAPFALILDDFEYVHEPAVLGLVREILDHLPRRGQLIIGSRGLPDLGLGRLRARGHLLEIDAAELRFSMDETAEFFTRHRHIPLGEDDLSQLYRKTEGWIAAIWLASMALERREGRSEFIARFSGSDAALADYLADDVVSRQPPHIRDFLLRTSILRHLDASLCNALLERSDGAQILTRLEAANLFLLPIEGEEKTYRYHSLFAGFLREQLTREMPDELPRLHRAASLWYEGHGRPVPAIDHALDGHDYAHALALLTRHAEGILEEGRMRLLTRWFTALPEGFLQDSPSLQIVRVWALCFTHGPWEAMDLLESSAGTVSGTPDIRAHVLALRPTMLSIMDRNEEAYEAGTEALSYLPISKPFFESALENAMAYVVKFMGRYEESRKLLDASRHRQGKSSGFFNRMFSESIEGMIDLEEGRLRQATARFHMAVSATHAAAPYTHTHGNAFAGIFYGDALYEKNDLEHAARLLHVYVPLIKGVGLADHMIIGYLNLARIAFCRGDIDQVFHYLTELEYVGSQRHLPRVVASARLERARIFLLQGNKPASREELRRANDPSVWQRVARLRMPAHDLEYFELGELRWEVHFGDAAQALARLDAEIAAAHASSRQRRACKLQVVKSLALKNSGDCKTALAVLDETLRHTCKEEFQRLVIDEGDGVGLLVRRLAEAMRDGGAEHSDPIYSEYLQRLLRGFGPGASVADEDTLPREKELVEPLTPKEIRILLLLAEGYSNTALSEKLFVSDSTVRTHLRNINGKLNAQSRTQAVAIARRLGIIR
jgi:LuxR family maltose regulon positive regulatory protein